MAGARQSAEPRASKLDALTGLRFFAAFAIVIHHCRPVLPPDFLQAWPLDHAVSFFFVLSGFILTYAYPKLTDRNEVMRFWLSRVARLWPGHIAALIFALAISPSMFTGTWQLVANVLLVHSWIPSMNYFFSYNSVSWSISTEFGFYLLFPLLIANFRTTWALKLAGAGVALLALIALCQFLPVPELDTNRPADFSSTGLLYINPMARLFEFVLGMCTALLWRRTRDYIASALLWTVAEVAAIGLALWTMRYGLALLIGEIRNGPLPIAEAWAIHAGSCLALAVVVFVMAVGQGAISRTLSLPWFIFLGEISYAMYLLHLPIIVALLPHMRAPDSPLWLYLGVGFAALLALSAAMVLIVERPCRVVIMSLSKPSRRAAIAPI